MLGRSIQSTTKNIVTILLSLPLNAKAVVASCRWRILWYLAFSSAFGSLMLLSGKVSYGRHDFSGFGRSDILVLLFYFVAAMLFCLILHAFTSKPRIAKTGTEAPTWRYWLLCSVIMLACWLIFYLFYAPAIISADSLASIEQAQGLSAPSNHHPYYFTLLLSMFVNGFSALLGSPVAGIVAYAVFQMALMACTFGYLLIFLAKENVSRVFRLLLLVFFCINPVVATFSFVIWKDIPFALALLLLSIQLFKIVESKGACLISKRRCVALAAVLLCVCLFRNNGIYVASVAAAAACLIYRNSWRKLVPACASALVSFAILTGPVFSALNVAQTEFTEAIGIPLQQIGYAARYGTLSDDQAQYLSEKLMPPEQIANLYDPQLSNPIKFAASAQVNAQALEQDKLGFLLMWASIGMDNPKEYAKGYLLQVMAMWRPATSPSTAVDYYYPATQMNLFGEFSVDVRSDADRLTAELTRVPVLGRLFDISLLVWLHLLAVSVLIVQRRKRCLLVLLPSLTLIATLFLATPFSIEIRYILGAFMSLPVTLLVLLRNDLSCSSHEHKKT